MNNHNKNISLEADIIALREKARPLPAPLLAVLLIGCGGGGGGGSRPVPVVVPDPTSTPKPTPTPEPVTTLKSIFNFYVLNETEEIMINRLRKLDANLSIDLFGNTIGLLNNLYRFSNNSSLQDGLLKLKPLNADILTSIKNKYQELIENPFESSERGTRLGNGQIVSRIIYDKGNFAQELEGILNQYSNDISKAIGGHPSFLELSMYRNYAFTPESDKEYISEQWHNDRRPRNYWKIFINLSDVGEDCGPLNVLPHTFTASLLKELRSQQNLSYSIYNRVRLAELPRTYDKYVSRLTGLAGTAVMANTAMCLHRATIPRKTRDILHLMFR